MRLAYVLIMTVGLTSLSEAATSYNLALLQETLEVLGEDVVMYVTNKLNGGENAAEDEESLYDTADEQPEGIGDDDDEEEDEETPPAGGEKSHPESKEEVEGETKENVEQDPVEESSNNGDAEVETEVEGMDNRGDSNKETEINAKDGKKGDSEDKGSDVKEEKKVNSNHEGQSNSGDSGKKNEDKKEIKVAQHNTTPVSKSSPKTEVKRKKFLQSTNVEGSTIEENHQDKRLEVQKSTTKAEGRKKHVKTVKILEEASLKPKEGVNIKKRKRSIKKVKNEESNDSDEEVTSENDENEEPDVAEQMASVAISIAAQKFKDQLGRLNIQLK